MGITYLEKERIFQLDTRNTSYCIGIVDEENFVGHIYYGKRIQVQDTSYLLRTKESPFVPSKNNRDRTSFLDSFPMEYSGNGKGDYRESSIVVTSANHDQVVEVSYQTFKQYSGKEELTGLPATFGDPTQVETLVLYCKDETLNLSIELHYSVFEEVDVITRSVKVVNESNQNITLNKVMSMCLDMEDQDYELLTLHGSWARERQIQLGTITHGKQGVNSIRGESSHQEHPFLGLKEKTATQDQGEVYGVHFVYSGNFIGQVEKNQFDGLRVVMGIHPDTFSWLLEPNQSFQAPEVVLTYSNQGLGQMSRNLHDLYRNHLIRGKYKDKKRPVLINNWEATYFDFNSKKLLDIAKNAASLGVEMLVMDDGWFGKRNDDNTSLGDWVVDTNKLPEGLPYLVEEVNKLGMKFGIWLEPEMVSPDSELFRAHPDWAIGVEGRDRSLCRNQYVLDLSRSEVREEVYRQIYAVLSSCNIEYVKWDMNRQLSDLGSIHLPLERKKELSHRYVLGVYELQDRLIKDFPELLLENCSGGGARFDPGMLYYSPQIWCSDDTDAIERLKIQEGTSLIYPLSAIGAHVSDCPNHTVGRVTPFETRGIVALAGTFGYELDVTKIKKEEQQQIPEQIATYHQYNGLIRTGDYYRLASFGENHIYDAYMIVSKDKKEALITYVQVLREPNIHSRRLRLKGLEEQGMYQLEDGSQLSGDVLMNGGLLMPPLWGDYQGKLIYLKKRE